MSTKKPPGARKFEKKNEVIFKLQKFISSDVLQTFQFIVYTLCTMYIESFVGYDPDILAQNKKQNQIFSLINSMRMNI